MEIPKVRTLREAVNEVIKNNKRVGYPPNRFIQMVNVADRELPRKCVQLLSNPPLPELYEAIKKHPGLLTLEDILAENGSMIKDIDDSLVGMAKSTVEEHFNKWRAL